MASRDDDKLMAGMLRRSFSPSSRSEVATSGNACPPPDVLAAYYEHSLGEDESSHYELHFSKCARCREQLAVLVRAEGAAQPKPSWTRVLNHYWLAPALAVLALAVFFGTQRSRQTATTNQPSNPPLVAMSRAEKQPPQEPAAKSEAPIEAPRNAPSGQIQAVPSVPAERDSIAKGRQFPSSPAVADKKDLPANGRNAVELQKSADAASAPRSSAATDNTQLSANVTAAAPAAKNALAPSAPSRLSAPARTIGGTSFGSVDTTAEDKNESQKQASEAMRLNEQSAPAPLAQETEQGFTPRVFQTPNTKVLWRSADGSFVERSPDGGTTWDGHLLPGTSGEIEAGSSPTPKICWLVGAGGAIYMTRDAVNWKKIAPPVPADFSAVKAKDASDATVTAADGRKFQTTDGGRHWKSLP